MEYLTKNLLTKNTRSTIMKLVMAVDDSRVEPGGGRLYSPGITALFGRSRVRVDTLRGRQERTGKAGDGQKMSLPRFFI
jgi:hypothetical protein